MNCFLLLQGIFTDKKLPLPKTVGVFVLQVVFSHVI